MKSTPTRLRPAPPTPRTSLPFSNGPKAVGSFIPKLAKKSFERYGFATAAILTDWNAIVGSDLASYTQPERLRWPRLPADTEKDGKTAGRQPRTGATLVLRVESARALDIQYRAQQLIERINAYFGYRAVTDLRLIQAPIDIPASPGTVRVKAPRNGATKRPAVDLSSIENAELRDALTKLAASVGEGQSRGR